ncbi:hypothetical protein AAY473_000815 [Plecturocebus cupreus]
MARWQASTNTCQDGWSAVVRSQLNATSASQIKEIHSPQPSELECSNTVTTHCCLKHLGSKAKDLSMFLRSSFANEQKGSPYVAQAVLKFLTSSDPPTSAFQTSVIIDMSCYAWP